MIFAGFRQSAVAGDEFPDAYFYFGRINLVEFRQPSGRTTWQRIRELLLSQCNAESHGSHWSETVFRTIALHDCIRTPGAPS
jgi:hypothetical protein